VGSNFSDQELNESVGYSHTPLKQNSTGNLIGRFISASDDCTIGANIMNPLPSPLDASVRTCRMDKPPKYSLKELACMPTPWSPGLRQESDHTDQQFSYESNSSPILNSWSEKDQGSKPLSTSNRPAILPSPFFGQASDPLSPPLIALDTILDIQSDLSSSESEDLSMDDSTSFSFNIERNSIEASLVLHQNHGESVHSSLKMKMETKVYEQNDSNDSTWFGSSTSFRHASWTLFPHFLHPVYFNYHDSNQIQQITSFPLFNTASESNQEALLSSQDYFVDRFEILDILGNGSFANVFKVQDRISKLVYAIKRTNRPFAGFNDRSRKIKEVETMWSLNLHPSCLSLIDCWEQHGHLYLQLEYCDSGSLHSFIQQYMIQQGKMVTESMLWNIISQLSEGLQHIHNKGYVHLDIKPENILITAQGTLKLADFGLTARFQVNDLSESSAEYEPHNTADNVDSCRSSDIMEGDKLYLAPELLDDGQAPTPASDVFSLGLILLEMAANIELPSQGDAWRALRSGQFETIQFEDHLSSEIVRLILNMLHPTPSMRPTLTEILNITSVASNASTLANSSTSIDKDSGWSPAVFLSSPAFSIPPSGEHSMKSSMIFSP
jgi:serine/threonine protein kinase